MPTPDFVVELRKHVGHAPLWLHGVTAVVVAGSRVLLGRRADDGAWTPITGIIDPGEEPATAAAREVLEETGVVAMVERLASVGSTPIVEHANGDLAQYLDLTFRCRYVSGEPHVADDESTDVGWFDLHDLPAMPPPLIARVDAAVHGGPEALFAR